MKIINVMAASLDGFIASKHVEKDAERRSYGFTNEADRQFVRKQIHGCDAVITGANSMRASEHPWEELGLDGQPPHWYVLTTKGLAHDLAFWEQTSTPRTLVSPGAVDLKDGSGVKNLVYGQEHPASFLSQFLKTSGVRRALLFGGGQINQLFYSQGLVDELRLTICPLLIGQPEAPRLLEGVLPRFAHFTLNSFRAEDDHIFVHYFVRSANPEPISEA